MNRNIAQPLDCFHTFMVNKGFPCVQRVDGSHIFFTKLKIPYIIVFYNSFLVNRFWDCHNPPLNVPAQDYLCYRFVVLVTNGREDFIFENVIFPLNPVDPTNV